MALKEEVYGLIYRAEQLCRGCREAKPLVECLNEMRSRLDEPLRVAVVGIMKAGKSTFMNALMGASILYTGNLETTYTVGWFRYAPQPSLTICFRDGSTQNAPFEDLEKWSVRTYEKLNPRINDVKYLIIYYPSEVLKQLEFIDTPGLNSVYGTDAQNTLDFLSIKGSEDTLHEASMADAIIYAFSRSAAGYDKEILDAFHQGSGNSSPINSIGILTKVDATGIWDIWSDLTPVEAAQVVTKTVMDSPSIKRLLFSAYPVCAKVVEGYTQLNEVDWDALRHLSALEADCIPDFLYDAGQFSTSTDEEFQSVAPFEVRTHLMNTIGQYGVVAITELLRDGVSKGEIGEKLQKLCGIESIRQVLLSHFGTRTFLIKTRYIFTHIRSMINTLKKQALGNSQLGHICRQIDEEMEDLMSSIQVLKELKVLQMYYNNQLSFDTPEEVEDLLHVTGEYGRSAEARLGMPEGTTVARLEETAREKTALWHEKSGGWMHSGAYVEAAGVLARSYEQMVYHLSALSQD